MKFIHEDDTFDDLLRIVAEERGFRPGLVEKDYWVIHSLWSLHKIGFDVWFKGGTSLSKGFDLIKRFSEDLDLKVDPGTVLELPKVSNWESRSAKASEERRTYFAKLRDLITMTGSQIVLNPPGNDWWRNADIQVHYPGRQLADLGSTMTKFVRLEVGDARVTPFIPRDLTSFVHEKLIALDQFDGYFDNRPKGVRCVHPLVTLLEKIDALQNRFPNGKKEPASFVRHYEDAAWIIESEAHLPPLPDYPDKRALAADMTAKNQIARLPTSDIRALKPDDGPRWKDVRMAFQEIEPMFWGPRMTLDSACAIIRKWVSSVLL